MLLFYQIVTLTLMDAGEEKEDNEEKVKQREYKSSSSKFIF
jgi:hypothetical protein